MLALIDADVVAYRIGFTTNNEDLRIALSRCDEMLDGILEETKATSFQLWLSDWLPNNFRYQLYPAYKANRQDKEKPVWLEQLKEHMVKEWGARFSYGMEADDALGIQQTLNEKADNFGDDTWIESAICSIDKDLLQIPGRHYNFVKKEWAAVQALTGMKWFYKQILIGDTADEIPGCEGIGPVKSHKIIDPCTNEAECFQAVMETYKTQWQKKKIDGDPTNHIRLVGRLLKIKQSEDEPLWDFPELPQTVALTSSSTQPQQETPVQSTEHTMQDTSSAGA
jgi:5'-3' exonuclease